MTLAELLSKLPQDLVMNDLSAIGSNQEKTVAQIIAKYGNQSASGYAVNASKHNYGKETKIVVSVNGMPAFIQK